MLLQANCGMNVCISLAQEDKAALSSLKMGDA